MPALLTRRPLPTLSNPTTPTSPCTVSGTVLGHDPGDSLTGLEDTIFHDDKSQAYVILEAFKFFNLDVARSAIDSLTELTGQDFDFDRRRWREWIGARHDEYAPPPDYGRWKVNALAVIDPDIAAILEPGIDHSRVNLTEVVWGGVRLDGIPPLEHAPYVLPEEADYLLPDDRVFGVSINGETPRLPPPGDERPRAGQRRPGRRTHLPGLLNPLRNRNRVFRHRQRRGHHLRHLRPALPQQQGDVRPGHPFPVESVRRRAGHRPPGRLRHPPALLPVHRYHLGRVAGRTP